MQQDDYQTGAPKSNRPKTALTVLIIVAATLGILTWAVVTLFEVAILKALAAVVIAIFVIAVALMLLGVGF